MKAYEILGAGGVDALSMSERSEPNPGRGEVKIRIRASSINYRDLVTIEDPIARKLSLPCVPNSDGVGEVVELGAGVTRVKLGDRVMGCFFQRWSRGEISPEGMFSALGGSLECFLAFSNVGKNNPLLGHQVLLELPRPLIPPLHPHHPN
jgi:NADPH:quinone reductase-like Zn-dependent oxidoreductase